MSVVALVPDDGCGEGVGRGQSAALLPVAGVPLVVHLVRRLFAAGCVDRALISVAADDLTAVSGALDQHGAGPPGAWSVLPTGRDGADAIRAAFAEALARVPAVEVVLVHQVL